MKMGGRFFLGGELRWLEIVVGTKIIKAPISRGKYFSKAQISTDRD